MGVVCCREDSLDLDGEGIYDGHDIQSCTYIL